MSDIGHGIGRGIDTTIYTTNHTGFQDNTANATGEQDTDCIKLCSIEIILLSIVQRIRV